MALIQAVKQGNIRGIKLVIGSHKGPGHLSGCATTPLVEACKFCDKKISLEMVKILLKNDARINDTDSFGRNALHWACSLAQREVIELFLKSKEIVDFDRIDLNGNSVLYHAVSSADCNFIKFICRVYHQNGGGVESRNKQGISAVDLALKLGHKSCAALVNRVTGLNQYVSTAGNGELNFCETKFPRRSEHVSRGNIRSKNRGISFPVGEANGFVKELGRSSSNHYLGVGLASRRYISLSSENLVLENSPKLPKLRFGNMTEGNISNRQRSRTHPLELGKTKSDEKLTTKKNFSKAEFLLNNSGDELQSPNTYKDLLVDFNLISSVESSPSYRKGFTKPKEKTKIVKFSDSFDEDGNGVEKRDEPKQEEKSTKTKVGRKISKLHESKTFVAKKERRKSRKSRDEG